MSLELEASKTGRGFAIVKFDDFYGKPCSLQKSSLASDDAIWLGVHLPEPQIMARDAVLLGLQTHGQTAGWVPYEIPQQVMIPTRMHLTRDQVAELIPILQHFADTGELRTNTAAGAKQMNIPEIKPLRFGGICYIQDIDGMPLVRRDGSIAFSSEKGALESIKARGYESCKLLDGSLWNKEPKP